MTEEEFDDYRDMRNPDGHPDRIKGNMTVQNINCIYNHDWELCPIRFSCDDGEDCMEAYEDKEELRQKNKRNSK